MKNNKVLKRLCRFHRQKIQETLWLSLSYYTSYTVDFSQIKEMNLYLQKKPHYGIVNKRMYYTLIDTVEIYIACAGTMTCFIYLRCSLPSVSLYV